MQTFNINSGEGITGIEQALVQAVAHNYNPAHMVAIIAAKDQENYRPDPVTFKFNDGTSFKNNNPDLPRTCFGVNLVFLPVRESLLIAFDNGTEPLYSHPEVTSGNITPDPNWPPKDLDS